MRWWVWVSVSIGMLLMLAAAPLEAQTGASAEASARRALAWLRSRQRSDGGYGDVATTVAVLRALGDAGETAANWRLPGRPSLLDYLGVEADAFARRDTISAGQLVVALVAAGRDPRAFAGVNTIARLQAHFDPHHRLYGGRGGGVLEQAWALLALGAVREPAPDNLAAQVLAWQDTTGGWAADDGGPTAETTAIVITGLLSAGVDPGGAPMQRAVSFLSRSQATDGGFTRAAGCGCRPDSHSTALATQAILMLGRDPLTQGWRRPGGTPPSWLMAAQEASGGVARHTGAAADVRSTALAVSALLGRPLPPRGRVPATRDALAWLRQYQTAAGGFGADGRAADIDFTLDVVLALGAAGEPMTRWTAADGTPLDYLATAFTAPAVAASNTVDLGRLIVAVSAVGADPRAFNGQNLVAQLARRLNLTTGAYGPTALDQAWALLALAVAGETPPARAGAYLVSLQAEDGGWTPLVDTPTDTVTTATALRALALLGADPLARMRAVAYLAQRQQSDGGFSAGPVPGVTSSVATAAAILGLTAAGEWLETPPWTRHADVPEASALPTHSPARALLNLQTAAGGFLLQRGFTEADPAATARALVALSAAPAALPRAPIQIFLPNIGK